MDILPLLHLVISHCFYSKTLVLYRGTEIIFSNMMYHAFQMNLSIGLENSRIAYMYLRLLGTLNKEKMRFETLESSFGFFLTMFSQVLFHHWRRK